LGDLAGAWDELVSAQPLASPFLRSWWIEHAAGGEPVLACWFEGDRLVGGAAFERDRPGRGPASIERLRSLGQGVLAPDHLDLIATDEHRDAVAAAVVAWLHRPGSRIVDLDGLAADGRLATLLVAHELERVGAPYVELPDAPDTYVAARPGKVRSTISRTAKRFAKQGVVHRRVQPDDAGRALDELARLHEGRWAEESSFLEAWGRFRAAALVGVRAGDVRLHEMVAADGTVVATELDLLVGSRTCFYQAGRSTDREWRGGGSVLRAEIIAGAIAEGRVEYDLLRGDEPYKSDWSDGRREVVRCRVGVGPLGRAVLAAVAMRAAVSRAASRRLRSARPGPTG
jgi:CelD/BcsL family acetyltransferase involved in cellulose biosynthesis